MSYQPPQQHDRYSAAAYVITFPYFVASSVISLTKKALAKSSKPAVSPAQIAPTPPSNQLEITPNQIYQVADRVFSFLLGEFSVSLFLYSSARVIRINARKQGFRRELIFTEDMANELCVPFVMESAKDWVTKVGFSKSTQLPKFEKSAKVEEAKIATPTIQSDPVNAENKQSSKRPFTGKIVHFGEAVKPGIDGKPPYTTFVLKLENNYCEREFIGEQLAELVSDKSLKIGQSVRLHSLGKQRFTVTIDGKPEPRSRNEYAIDLI